MVPSSPSSQRRQPLTVEVTYCVQGVVTARLPNAFRWNGPKGFVESEECPMPTECNPEQRQAKSHGR